MVVWNSPKVLMGVQITQPLFIKENNMKISIADICKQIKRMDESLARKDAITRREEQISCEKIRNGEIKGEEQCQN